MLLSADCTALDIMKSKATTQEAKDKYTAGRRIHSEEIMKMRSNYHAAQVLSRGESNDLLTIALDGTDSNCCHCPQHWQEAVHGDADKNTFVEQSIMSVVIHGAADKVRYYVTLPVVSQRCHGSIFQH